MVFIHMKKAHDQQFLVSFPADSNLDAVIREVAESTWVSVVVRVPL
mgnify:CR=1 FL=1|jgi:hypothetical protein